LTRSQSSSIIGAPRSAGAAPAAGDDKREGHARGDEDERSGFGDGARRSGLCASGAGEGSGGDDANVIGVTPGLQGEGQGSKVGGDREVVLGGAEFQAARVGGRAVVGSGEAEERIAGEKVFRCDDQPEDIGAEVTEPVKVVPEVTGSA
jgi:hypothetical protein